MRRRDTMIGSAAMLTLLAATALGSSRRAWASQLSESDAALGVRQALERGAVSAS